MARRSPRSRSISVGTSHSAAASGHFRGILDGSPRERIVSALPIASRLTRECDDSGVSAPFRAKQHPLFGRLELLRCMELDSASRAAAFHGCRSAVGADCPGDALACRRPGRLLARPRDYRHRNAAAGYAQSIWPSRRVGDGAGVAPRPVQDPGRPALDQLRSSCRASAAIVSRVCCSERPYSHRSHTDSRLVSMCSVALARASSSLGRSRLARARRRARPEAFLQAGAAPTRRRGGCRSPRPGTGDAFGRPRTWIRATGNSAKVVPNRKHPAEQEELLDDSSAGRDGDAGHPRAWPCA